MALTRGELKNLVKQLLVEVLQEGLGSNLIEAARPAVPQRSAVRPLLKGASTQRPNGNGGKKPFDPRLDTPISEAVRREAGNNPVMRSILADTAASTLPALAEADRNLGRSDIAEGPSHGIQQVEQISGTPEEVFGDDVAGKWADLAFDEPKKPV